MGANIGEEARTRPKGSGSGGGFALLVAVRWFAVAEPLQNALESVAETLHTTAYSRRVEVEAIVFDGIDHPLDRAVL
jgi:hypothetical protein